ncbi:MAG: alanine--tRNA ligase-related protein, partial [Candidatus Nanohaloarchaea archaeon]
LNDGLLPSNRGERHSLRVMARRCFQFIDDHGWDLDLEEVVEWHADEFGELYPELEENVGDVKEIIRHEEEKYREMKEEAERLMEDLEDVSEDDLVELYDSKGITPEMLERHGVDVEVPPNFYQRVAERHSEGEEEGREGKGYDLEDVEDTEPLYYRDERMQEFEGEVLKVVDNRVVLDRTAFYPTGGGQEHDTGSIDGVEVVDVEKQDGVILHELDPGEEQELPEPGDTVEGVVDWERRRRLMHHHTATHVINGAARELLGNHVWQEGAHKSEEKGRLDISHYEKVGRDMIERIQEEANRIVEEDRDVTKKWMGRKEAEGEYGFRLYQGGAVPGNEIRVVDIEGWDAEACGGTHVDSTGELDRVVVTGSKKVQDGTIRIEYVAGDAAEEFEEGRELVEDQVEEYVDVDRSLLDIAEIFSVEVEQLPRVVERFADEWEERKAEIERLKREVGEGPSYGKRPRDPEKLFEQWKQMEKDIDALQERLEEQLREELQVREGFVKEEIDTEDVGMLIRISRDLVDDDPGKAVLLVGRNGAVAASGEESSVDAREEVEKISDKVQGDKGFAKGFDLR